MDIILKGFYSSYSRNGKMVPIIQKKDVVEDSSWNNLESPNYNQLEELARNIREDNNVISDKHVSNKLSGIPTHPIIESYIDDNREFGVWWENRKNTGILLPEIQRRSIFEKRTPFSKQSDRELIEIAFTTVMFSKYGAEIKRHFVDNSGMECDHGDMGHLKGHLTGLKELLAAVEGKVKNEYEKKYPLVSLPVDVSKEIYDKLSFRASIVDFNEMIAIGGVQQIELEGRLLSFIQGGRVMNKQGTKNQPYIMQVELKFIIKDWFGVDEEDVYKRGLATFLDREGLAALWVLQHNRGYKPFINRFEYKKRIPILFYK